LLEDFQNPTSSRRRDRAWRATIDRNGGYSYQGLREAKERGWPNHTAFPLRGLGRAGEDTVPRLTQGARLSLGSGPKAHPKCVWLGNRRAPRAPKNAHPKRVWMRDGLGWEWMGESGGRDDGTPLSKAGFVTVSFAKRMRYECAFVWPFVRAVPTVRVQTDISATLQKRVSDGATCPEMTFHQQYDAVRSGNAPPAT